ncbi:MAG: hypothetical protein J6K25_07425 [Thermoguttaceae bacterium]|nr:hypothetical protein [Thermoguttaceae bacterium]
MERERNKRGKSGAEKDGIRKAALFLSILDAKAADALLERFEPDVAREVEEEARRIGSVAPEDVDAIVAEFLALSEPEEKDEGTRPKKRSALVDEQANEKRDEFQPLDAIKPERLATLLSGASRTTIAVALARLSERRRSAVVALLPTEKAEGARRVLAALVRTTDAARRLEDALFNGACGDE